MRPVKHMQSSMDHRQSETHLKWTMAVTLTALTVSAGCGRSITPYEKRQDDKIESLSRDVSERDKALSVAETKRAEKSAEIETLKRDLGKLPSVEARAAAAAAHASDTEAKLTEVNAHLVELAAAKDAANAALMAASSLRDKALAAKAEADAAASGANADKEKALAAKAEADAAASRANADKEKALAAKAAADLAVAEATVNRDRAFADVARAKAELAKTLKEKALAEKGLGNQQRLTLQAFLENAGPDSMFAATGSDVESAFGIPDQTCAVIVDLGQDLQIVRGPQRDPVPTFRGFDTLPMRVSYKKIALCDKGSSVDAQVENGFLYRVISATGERLLVAARSSGSCDQLAADVKSRSIFGEVLAQAWSPFRGDIDGIESIDIPQHRSTDPNDATKAALRLTMGSVLESGGSTCARVIQRANDGAILKIGCMVLLGKDIAGKSVNTGCFAATAAGLDTPMTFEKR